ncbi:AaceriAGL153Cp [[Ashbya] aceris (nom. inval.)]|nr:AaceriAGL153Cp [[Ashbya] aceris (nom. inval.)]
MTIQSITGSSFSGGDVSAGSDKVYQNYLMPTLKLYDAKVSINHWQLRDCVKCSSTGLGSVYYIYDHSIRTLDTRSTAAELQNEKMERRRRRSSMCGVQRSDPWRDHRAPSELVVQFDYKPRCFQENGGLIACGGLISSDDIGSTVSRSGRHEESEGGGQTSGVLTPSQVEPIRLANSDILTDYSFYGDQQSWKGILALYNMENGVSLTYKLGQYINNCVELYQRTSQQYDLYTCNNDSHLYQCDVSNRGVELTRRYSDLKFALNCAAISHDGKTMVVSGDSSKFAVYRQNELSGCFSLQYDAAPEWGSKWSRTKCVPRYAAVDRSEFLDRIYDSPGGDNGFYTSYSENDVHMATIFQNGLCLVYDMRKMDTPLAEIPSTRRHAQNGSFRVCKFSRSFDDLLFISEHQSHVHVVDTRNLMNHQVIVIPDKVRNPDENVTPSPNSGVARASPTSDDPCVTRATRLPIRSLEPEVLPYPDVAQYSNSFQNVSSDEDAIDQLASGFFQNRRRHSSFRVRRYSTSSIINSTYPRALEDIDPSILDHHYTQHNYRAVDNYNYVNDQPQRGSPARVSRRVLVPGRSRRAMAVEDIDDDTLEEDNGAEDDDDNPMMGYAEAYNEINEITHGSQFRFENIPPSSAIPRRQGISMALTNILNRTRDNGSRSSRTPAFSAASGADLFEENSISGIDWVQDQEGSSLIIGTDYGIIKWNINSWARRSFPCYDFC